ncbi:hypothetical protein BGZ83_006522 [Gryganskiella cystojenkinii]|nr:hypothetical protein BGZ83_006522 [Gryganskiella cystojenkinii]
MSSFTDADFPCSWALLEFRGNLWKLSDAHREELVKKVGCVYLFNVKNSKNGIKSWTLNLKDNKGSIDTGKSPKASVIFDIDDASLSSLIRTQVSVQQLLNDKKKRVKVEGSAELANKLSTVFAIVKGNTSQLKSLKDK